MEVTELGITILVMPLQKLNAAKPMAVTVLGMIVFMQPRTRVLDAVSIMALQLLRESYTVLPLSTVILVRL